MSRQFDEREKSRFFVELIAGRIFLRVIMKHLIEQRIFMTGFADRLVNVQAVSFRVNHAASNPAAFKV